MNESLSMPTPAVSGAVAARFAASGFDLRLEPGAPLGAFEIGRVLARGAFSTVYFATDHALALPVAIQEYLPARLVQRDEARQVRALHLADEARVARGLRAFIDEARWLARCDHPALVRVMQLIEMHGTAYRVMPFYDGRRLREVRREMHAAPDEASLRHLLDGLLGAVEALHRGGGGREHGNITPSNILLLADDRPLLLGPGDAARELSSDLVDALMAGVQPSPLPAGNAPGGAASDVAALAEVARFCITGEWPDAEGARRHRPTLASLLARGAAGPGAPPRYSAAFIGAIDAATAPAAARRAPTTALLRHWLEHGVPGAAPLHPGAAPPAPEADAGLAREAAAEPGLAREAAAEPPWREAVAGPREPGFFGGDADAPAFEPATASKPEPSFDSAAADRAPWGETALAPALARRADEARRRRLALILGGLAVVGAVLAALALGARQWLPELSLAAPTMETAAAIEPSTPTPAPPPAPATPPTDVAGRAPTDAGAPGVGGAEPRSAAESAAESAAARTAGADARPTPTAPTTTPATTPPEAVAGAPAAAPEGAPPAGARLARTPPRVPAAVRPAPLAKRASKPVAARPAAARPAPPAPAAAPAPRVAGADTPRAACAPRTEFALYRCMQVQCRAARWSAHPQCVRLRVADEVG